MATSEPPLVEKVSKRSPFGALLTRTLPNYSGPYPVGVCDVELPVPRQTFGTFKHKLMPESEAGLSMDTVLFTIFYPAGPRRSSKRVVWFPKSVYKTARVHCDSYEDLDSHRQLTGF